MNRAHWTTVSLLLTVSMLFGGCTTNLTKAYPQQQRYVLHAPRDGAAVDAATNRSVRVRRFRISSRYSSSELVVRTRPTEYETDFYHTFLSAPDAMITEEVRDWLSDSGLFKAVVGTGSQLPTNYLLEGNVIALYEDRAVMPPTAVMAIQFFLLDETTGLVPFQKKYRVTLPIAEGPAARVVGYNRALAHMLAELESDLSAVLTPALE